MTFWRGKRVFITGGTGLIGGALCRKLIEQGASITSYGLPGIGTLKEHGIAGEVRRREGDIRDTEGIARAAQSHEIVFHLAAVSGVNDSRLLGSEAFDINVRGTWCVLDACLQTQPLAVVTASSNHVYGKQERFPVPETASLNQLDTYSASKIAGDIVARAYAHNYELPVAVIRNTNCYGPIDPHGEHIIPATILAALEDKPPVIKSNGQRSKSYLYVDDVADAYMEVAEWIVKTGTKGEAFNVSCPPISVLNLVYTILDIMGKKNLSPHVLSEPNDQNDENLDWLKVQVMVGWTPKHTLREGLEKTVAGFRQRVTA